MYKYSLIELKSIAEELAQNVVAPHVILLYGNLGSGKTTFTKFFIQSISSNNVTGNNVTGNGVTGDNINTNNIVTSPTFNIINTYETNKGTVWHADLYRLNSISELEPLGLLDFIYSYITIIEWPDIIKPYIKNVNFTEIYL